MTLLNYEFHCDNCKRIKRKKTQAFGYKTGDIKRKKVFSLCRKCKNVEEISSKRLKEYCPFCRVLFVQATDSYIEYRKKHVSFDGRYVVCEDCVRRESLVYLLKSESARIYKVGRTTIGVSTRVSSARIVLGDFYVMDVFHVSQAETITLERSLIKYMRDKYEGYQGVEYFCIGGKDEIKDFKDLCRGLL